MSQTMPVIRPVSPRDRAPLEQVLRSDDTFNADEIDVAIELIDAALDDSPDYRVLVATLNDGPEADRVVGYLCYGPTPMTASTYDLYWVVTHVAARGRRVATALIEAMEADLRERRGTGVRVETSQLEGYGAARELYRRRGYPEVARLTDFYRAGDDLIIFYKRL